MVCSVHQLHVCPSWEFPEVSSMFSVLKMYFFPARIEGLRTEDVYRNKIDLILHFFLHQICMFTPGHNVRTSTLAASRKRSYWCQPWPLSLEVLQHSNIESLPSFTLKEQSHLLHGHKRWFVTNDQCWCFCGENGLIFLIQSTVNMASRAKETGIYMDFCSSGALTGGLHWDMVPFLVDVWRTLRLNNTIPNPS